MQLTYDQLLNIMGQYDSEGGRSLPPDIAQWLASQPYAEQPSMMGGGADRVYDFQQYDNQFGSAPVGPNGQPMFEPAEGWGGGMQSLRNAALVLGGTAAFGNLAMPYLAGGGGAAATGGGAAATGGAASAGGAGAAGAGAGAVGSGAGFVGEGAMSGVPAWDAAATGAGMSLTAPAAAAAAAPGLLDAARQVAGSAPDWMQYAAPLLGAGAAIAGNGDMNIGSTTSGTSSSNSTLNSSQTGATSQSGTATNSLAPWLQGHAQDYVGRAQSLANQPSSNANLDTAGGLLNQYATQGSPLVNSAMQQQQDVISGKFLNSNPYLDQVAKGIGDRMGEAYATGTRGSLTSNAQMSGNDPRYSSAYQQTVGNADRSFGDALGQTMSGLYMGNYQTERANQNNASQYAPNLANFGVNNAQNLANYGGAEWQRPFYANAQYGAAINPSFGSTSVNNQTGNTSQTGMQTGNQTGNTTGMQNQNIQAPNNWMVGAGGAAAGAGIYRNLFGG